MKEINLKICRLVLQKPSSIDRIISSLNSINKVLGLEHTTPDPQNIPFCLTSISTAIQSFPFTPARHLLIPEWKFGHRENLINSLIKYLNEDYQERRKVLLTRLDVTIAAFLWSSKCKVNSPNTALSVPQSVSQFCEVFLLSVILRTRIMKKSFQKSSEVLSIRGSSWKIWKSFHGTF